MRPKKLALGIVAVGTAVSTVFAFNLSVPFFRLQVLGQTANHRKVEADRLLNQGIEQAQTSQFEAAIQSWEQALIIYREIKDRKSEGSVLNNLSNVYRYLGDYPKAIDYLQQSLAIAREIKDRLGEGRSLGNLGSVYLSLRDYTKGVDYQQQSLVILRETKDRKGEGRLLGNLGLAYKYLGNYPKAIEYYKQSLAIAREIKDRQSEGTALNNLGLAYDSLGDYPKAIEQYQKSLAIAREIKDHLGEGNALGNLGLAYFSLGDYPKAIDYHQQNLAIAREIKDRKGEGQSLGNLGIAYLSLGNYPTAIDYLQQNLAITREIKDRLGEGQSLGNLGHTYFFLGDYPKAIDYHQQSLKIFRDIKYRQGEGQSLGSLGVAYQSLGDYPKAIDYHQQYLKIATDIKDRYGQGAALSNLGAAYQSLGDYPKAINYDQQSLAIAREIKDRQGEGTALDHLGVVYDSLGDYPKAIDYHQQSLALARKIKDLKSQSFSLNNLGAAFYKSGNLPVAEKILYEGIKVLESLRNQKLDDTNKVSIFETQISTYRVLQQVLIAENKNDAALEIAERGRARAFVELLASRISSDPQEQSPPPPNIEEIKQIAKTQNATLVQYSITDDDFKVAGKIQYKESEIYIWVVKPTGEVTFRKADLKPLLQKQNISLRDKVDQTRQSIVKGVNVASRGNNITLTPGDRVKLNDDDPDWEAWQVVSVDIKNSKITIRLPSWEASKPAIERPIADVVKKIDINSSGANAKNSQLQEFYQLLIQPIADLLPKEETARVIFIPQDALFLVPFPALQDPSGQYLIDKHTILTAPSIQVLDSTHKLRQKVPGLAKDILVVGNPTMPKVSLKPGEPPKQLSALPGSEKEALAIASFWKTRALIGNQATKKAVLQKLPLAKIIHLATHGLLDDIRGLGSSIVFALEGQDKGLLTAEDILNLYAPPQGSALSAELVVLSACDTGSGRLTGDGVIGLSRSIIAAGVPSVIVSLWSIPDAPSAELMTEFYENFRKNPDKAAALRQAMLTTKKKHPNPAEWAAFTLIGESE